jgi:hypothetical protein
MKRFNEIPSLLSWAAESLGARRVSAKGRSAIAPDHQAPSFRIGRARGLALVPLILVGTGLLWGQLKTTTYAQAPPVVVEPLIVKNSGFYPQKIVRPAGPFVLYIENRITPHTGHFSLTLNQANAPELTGLDISASSWQTSKLLDLQQGTYLLHFPGAQNWSLVIEIQ